MFIRVLGYGNACFGIFLMIQGLWITLMLQKGAYKDPWMLHQRLFWPKYHALYPLSCLATVFKRVLGMGRIYCGIHLMIRGFWITQKKVSEDLWRSPQSLIWSKYHTLYHLLLHRMKSFWSNGCQNLFLIFQNLVCTLVSRQWRWYKPWNI